MRPIKLIGHERPLTQIKYNREGDLLFSVAKDCSVSIWYSSNGERLGTLDGHKGVIWSIGVDSETSLCATGAGDLTIKLWKIQTGKCLYTWNTPSPVKWVSFSPDGTKLLAIFDQLMGHIGTVAVFEVNTNEATLHNQKETPLFEIETPKVGMKATVGDWSVNGEHFIVGHENGFVSKYTSNGDFVKCIQAHGIHNEEKNATITDIQFTIEDRSYFILSSKDKCATLIDVDEFIIKKVYKADAPLNTAAITPVKDFVILGGGQEARNVTTTSESQGKFEARFYHKIFEVEIGRVRGHFGPLNTIAVHPSGSSYSSGSEDGFVRIHNFDKSYYDFYFDAERTVKPSLFCLDR